MRFIFEPPERRYIPILGTAWTIYADGPKGSYTVWYSFIQQLLREIAGNPDLVITLDSTNALLAAYQRLEVFLQCVLTDTASETLGTILKSDGYDNPDFVGCLGNNYERSDYLPSGVPGFRAFGLKRGELCVRRPIRAGDDRPDESERDHGTWDALSRAIVYISNVAVQRQMYDLVHDEAAVAAQWDKLYTPDVQMAVDANIVFPRPRVNLPYLTALFGVTEQVLNDPGNARRIIEANKSTFDDYRNRRDIVFTDWRNSQSTGFATAPDAFVDTTEARLHKVSFRPGGMLIKEDDWLPLEGLADDRIRGNDGNVLVSPTMNKALNAVIDLHVPKHNLAVISTCVAKRPYSSGKKFGYLKAKFGKVADVIVMSNGGLVPLHFETEYPYTSYDAERSKPFDDVYKDVLIGRLLRFFAKHSYRAVMFLTPPTERNHEACQRAGEALVAMQLIDNFTVMPGAEDYAKVTDHPRYKTDGYVRAPVIHPLAINPVIRKLNQWLPDGNDLDLEKEPEA